MNKTQLTTKQATDPSLELFSNLVKVAKSFKKDPSGIDQFISNAKSEIAKLLIDYTKQRHLVKGLRNKTKSQRVFNSVIYSETEIWSEIYITIADVATQWEKNFRHMIATGKPFSHSSGKGAVRMERNTDIVGYFRNSLKNTFADLFIKHQAQKRSGEEKTFSSMQRDSDDDHERNYEDTLESSESSRVMIQSYKRDMISHVRNYDKKNKTSYARLFVALMNSRYKGAITVIQKKLKMNNKNFNESKNMIQKILIQEFGDVSQELISSYDAQRSVFEDLGNGNKASRKSANRSIQKALEKKRPCRFNVVYGAKPVQGKNKCSYYVTVLVDRSVTMKEISYSPKANWETIFKKEAVIVGKPGQMDKMKAKLEKMVKKEMGEAQQIVERNKYALNSDDEDEMLIAA
jgi:hypothetical protein